MSSPSSGTVMIVEDDAATRDMVVTWITTAGFRAVWAEDGLEALHLLRAVRRREPDVPCLILLDLSMPRLGGREFRRAQLSDPDVAGVPVVVMTGDVDAVAVSAGLGAVATLTKPLDVDRVIRTARQHCVTAASSTRSDGAPQRIGQ